MLLLCHNSHIRRGFCSRLYRHCCCSIIAIVVFCYRFKYLFFVFFFLTLLPILRLWGPPSRGKGEKQLAGGHRGKGKAGNGFIIYFIPQIQLRLPLLLCCYSSDCCYYCAGSSTTPPRREGHRQIDQSVSRPAVIAGLTTATDHSSKWLPPLLPPLSLMLLKRFGRQPFVWNKGSLNSNDFCGWQAYQSRTNTHQFFIAIIITVIIILRTEVPVAVTTTRNTCCVQFGQRQPQRQTLSRVIAMQKVAGTCS